jgi:predicted HTH transcriptional regulator
LIFSKKEPQRIRDLERYSIRCIRYKGFTPTSPIIDKEDIKGTLDQQIDRAYEFVLRNIAKRAMIKGTKRAEIYEYPESAIREAVANAVIHRDYRITQTYTQIAIFDDRIEISNPGNLPPGVTVENIKDAQMSRNETIAARLKDLGYLEEYGRGFDIIFEKMQEYGLLHPLIKNSVNQFQVILLGPRVDKLNERQLVLWKHLLEYGKLHPRQIREQLLPKIPRPTINLDLKRMKDAGLIEVVGSSSSPNLYYKIRH